MNRSYYSNNTRNLALIFPSSPFLFHIIGVLLMHGAVAATAAAFVGGKQKTNQQNTRSFSLSVRFVFSSSFVIHNWKWKQKPKWRERERASKMNTNNRKVRVRVRVHFLSRLTSFHFFSFLSGFHLIANPSNWTKNRIFSVLAN